LVFQATPEAARTTQNQTRKLNMKHNKNHSLTLLRQAAFLLATLVLAPALPLQADDATAVKVEIVTSLGPITVEVYADRAPLSANNFLQYVDAGKYDGSSLYRVVRLDNQKPSDIPIQVVQGGMYGDAMSGGSGTPPEGFPPVEHETTETTGLKHINGAISLARGEPGSATSEFFISIGDNQALDFGGMRNPDGQGFAVFGQVTSGMELVRQIQSMPSSTPLPEEMKVVHGQILETPVEIVSVRRLTAQDTTQAPTTPPPVLSIGETHTVASAILGEDRPYMVYLPEGCKAGGASAPCPVIYILDGPSHFHYGSGMLAHLAANAQIPEMIMVAVPNTADRMHDLTPTHTMLGYEGKESAMNATSGGGEAFFDFLEKELIPDVESRYTTMPYRLFSGHSLGGLMALHGFVERPGLFQAWIAVDPSLWWDDLELVRRAEQKLPGATDIRGKVFIGVADYSARGDGAIVTMETGAERFEYAMQSSPSPRLHSMLKLYPADDHGSVPFPSLYDGLLFVFDGYKNPPPMVTSRGLDAVEAYYRDYLGDYGIALEVPGGVLIGMAQLAQQQGDLDKAIAIMKYQLDKRPDDPMANFMAGMTFAKAGRKPEAIQHFERAKELAPQFATYIQPQLDELMKSE
jgi:predicted alpha/beta superfamily hydrolase/cyclophilin family peptidyl-prolyl cis-trans isomerase